MNLPQKSGQKWRKVWLVPVLLALLPVTVSAHPGGRDADGGHVCWTNCEEWGLKPGQYHFHEPGTNKPILPLPATAPVLEETTPAPPPPPPVVQVQQSKQSSDDGFSYDIYWIVVSFIIAVILSIIVAIVNFIDRLSVSSVNWLTKLLWRGGKKEPDKKKDNGINL